ncbi:MAG: hypothetical protein ACKV0T_11915 [Planctomycetales bacterium]
MKGQIRLLLPIALAIFGIGCSQTAPSATDHPPPPEVETDFARLRGLLSGIQPSAEVTVFEGLPGSFWEPQLREQELRRLPTFQLAGHPVYAEPLTVPTFQTARFTEIFTSPAAYTPYTSGKACGEFQVDYGLQWSSTDGATQVLICLECGEVQLHTPHGALHCDLESDAARQLQELLVGLRKNRPERQP